MLETCCLFLSQCLNDVIKIWTLGEDSAMTCPSLNTICQLLELPPTFHHLHSTNVQIENLTYNQHNGQRGNY
jgi:hypothetical protein